MLLSGVAEPVRLTRNPNYTGNLSRLASDGSASRKKQQQQQASTGEYAFNLAAFLDGRRSLVRVFSEIEPKYVEPIATGNLRLPHVNHCTFTAANGTAWSTATLNVDTQWAYGDDERIRKINKVQLFCRLGGRGILLFVHFCYSSEALIGDVPSMNPLETKMQD